MKKPSLDEIRAYCAENGIDIDAEAFLDHYEMVGWVTGRHQTPVKSWKACVRTWERNGRKFGSKHKAPAQHGIEQQAAALGLSAKPGESWGQFEARVRARRH